LPPDFVKAGFQQAFASNCQVVGIFTIHVARYTSRHFGYLKTVVHGLLPLG
jgi:hypothetical protein